MKRVGCDRTAGQYEDGRPMVKPVQEFRDLPGLLAESLGVDNDERVVAVIPLQEGLLERVRQRHHVTSPLQAPFQGLEAGFVWADREDLTHKAKGCASCVQISENSMKGRVAKRSRFDAVIRRITAKILLRSDLQA